MGNLYTDLHSRLIHAYLVREREEASRILYAFLLIVYNLERETVRKNDVNTHGTLIISILFFARNSMGRF